MPRCRDSIVNGRHLTNEKQTERCKKVCLGLSVAKNPLKLDRKTGKSTEEYAVAKVLLFLSMEPAMRSGEQIVQSKRL